MDSERERVIERIKKLMAYANDGSVTQGEIENALGKARGLMDKFNIDEQSVLINSESARRDAYSSVVDEEFYARASKIDLFDIHLAYVPCDICDVRMYVANRDPKPEEMGKLRSRRTPRYMKEYQTLHFYGLPRDVAVAKAMYIELLATMRAMARFSLGESWKAEFGAYCDGFVCALRAKARNSKRMSQQDTPATAGAIILAKDSILDRYRSEKLALSSLGRKSRGYRDESGAYEKGASDGSRVSLDNRGIGSSHSEPKRLA